MSEAATVEFGPFRFDRTRACVWRGEELLLLSPKAVAVLEILIRHAGQPVTKEMLLEAAWPDVVVGEAVLTVCIRTLRQSLGDSARTPQYIETLHRRGYRFIAPLSQAAAEMKVPTQTDYLPPTAQTLGTPNLVGRETELRRLQHCLSKAQSGERQLIFVTGEPGLGKTTLIDAFLFQLTQATPRWIASGQCIDHSGLAEPYLPVLDALGQLCQQAEGERVIRSLKQHAPTWLANLPSVFADSEPEISPKEMPAAMPERMLREITEALEALAVDRPVVLVLEDLHWSDGATIDLLNWIARRRTPAPLLIIGTYRPVDVIVREHPLHTIKQELVLHHLCTELALEFLSAADVSYYLSTRCAEHTLPDTLATTLYEHTGGHPLFLVSVVDEWLQRMSGQDTQVELDDAVQHIPENLREMITEQLAQCTDKQRQILQIASVVGVEFTAAAVAEALGATIDEVEDCCAGLEQRSQFVAEGELEEWPDGTLTASYRFRHALYQQTVYERLSATQRLRLHRQLGLQLADCYGEQAREHAVELAWHCEQGRLWEQATFHLRQAGNNALRRGAHQEVEALMNKALELLVHLPESPERLQQQLELYVMLGSAILPIRGQTDPSVESAFNQAQALCQQVDDTPQLFWTLVGLRKTSLGHGQVRASQALGERCIQLAQNCNDSALLMEAYYNLGNPLFWRGELNQARHCLEQCLTLHAQQPIDVRIGRSDPPPGIGSLVYLGLVLWLQGYPQQAEQRCQEAIALAQELEHSVGATMAHLFIARLHQHRRDLNATLHHAEQAITLADEVGIPNWKMEATYIHGWALVRQGQHETGIARMQQGLAAHQEAGEILEQPFFMAYLASVFAGSGQIEAGLDLLNQASALIDTTGVAWCTAEVLRVRGELLLQHYETDADLAQDCFHQALQIARQQHARFWELRAAVSLAQLWQKQQKREQAVALLAPIYDWFNEGFDSIDLQQAKTLLTQLQRSVSGDQ